MHLISLSVSYSIYISIKQHIFRPLVFLPLTQAYTCDGIEIYEVAQISAPNYSNLRSKPLNTRNFLLTCEKAIYHPEGALQK